MQLNTLMVFLIYKPLCCLFFNLAEKTLNYKVLFTANSQITIFIKEENLRICGLFFIITDNSKKFFAHFAKKLCGLCG